MLRRIRIGFALLAVLLLAPLGFLIGRTLDTLDRERELQHAAVANRVFDEAEGALAGFLREEQARPADAYRLQPLGASWMESSVPFVRAYFQVDADGGIRTSAGDPGLEALLGSAPIPEARAPMQAEKKRRQIGEKTAEKEKKKEHTREGSGEETAEAPKDEMRGESPAPGTARNVQSIDLVTGRAKAGKADASQAETDDEAPYSSNRALETLGRIAKVTAWEEAQQSVAPVAPSTLEDVQLERAERTRLEDRDASAEPRPEEAFAQADALEVDALEQVGSAERVDDAARVNEAERLAALAPSAPSRRAPRRSPLALAPSRLSGERVDDDRLLLYRTALDDAGRAVRQGMLVSVDDLGMWLTRRLLGESELRASLDLELRAEPFPATGSLPADRYVYAYRFAEPFETLSLQLAISPLDDGDNARNIGWLSALLIAASTLGLYAVYRVAAVAIHFAERRSNLAAAVSHELKTPLTAIRMCAEMLRDGMVTDEAKRNDYYQTITTESERLTRLIDNVLEWSKLEKHAHSASLVTADPAGAIREVVRVVGPHARAEGFEIDLALAASLPPVRHDPDALQQILYNLIDNAIKYARGHAPTRIEIEAAPVEGGVAIRVRDHGPGVSADKLPLVFEAFYRGEDELTRETKGTGIGLALARGLADSMKGTLHARNHPGGGFEVELRLSRVG